MDTDLFLKVDKKAILYNLINLKQLVFEVTDACNLRCKYCGYAELYEGYDLREDKYLPIEKAKLIIDYLADIWRTHLSKSLVQPVVFGFYGGEPLMNMKFIKEVINYLDTIKEVGKQFFFSMTTNAMLLNKYMDYIAEKKIQLLISLDGDEQGQSYRVDASGKNSFDRVIRNVKKLQEQYPDYFRKYVNFNSVLHNRNSVESTYHFIKNNFSKETRISPLNNSGIRLDKIEEFRNTYQNVEESIKKSLNCEVLEAELFIKEPKTGTLLSFIHNYSENVYDNYNDLFIDKSKLQSCPTGTCPPFYKKMFVTVNGKILQCEKINHEFALGQVYDDRVELYLEKAAKQHNDYVFRYQKQCAVCSINKQCIQCVFQIDDIHKPDTKCFGFRNAEAHKRYIKNNIDYLRKHPKLYGRLMREARISD